MVLNRWKRKKQQEQPVEHVPAPEPFESAEAFESAEPFESVQPAHDGAVPSETAAEPQQFDGPFDEAEAPEVLLNPDGRLDLGSVMIPIPEGSQVQVEMSPEGVPHAVHLMGGPGRITVAGYAAPRSSGQWNSVVAELGDALRESGASSVTVETGPWGRELFAVTEGADVRFIGIDGPRWMLRVVVAGPAESNAIDSPLAELTRAVIRQTVVRRGPEPLPAREPLPITLPPALAEQLAAAHQQQMAQQQAAAAAAAQAEQSAGPAQRRNVQGSAMQQLGE